MKFHRPATLATLLLAAPAAVSACTVCFGGADASLVSGFFWGVVILLALPFTMAAVFIARIVQAERRKKAS